MPLITISTSKEVKEKKEFIKKSAALIGKLTNKSTNFVMVRLNDSLDMYFANSDSPCCYVEIKSIGSLQPSNMSNEISEFINNEIGISSDRVYLSFEDVSATNWAWNGTTFG